MSSCPYLATSPPNQVSQNPENLHRTSTGPPETTTGDPTGRPVHPTPTQGPQDATTGHFHQNGGPWPKKSTGRPIGEIRAVHRPATGSVATQGTTGATFRGHRSDHRTPQDGAQDDHRTPQEATGRGTGQHRSPHRAGTGSHRQGHTTPQDHPQGTPKATQRTGDGATARKARGPKPHGGMAKRAPISPPEQSANRRLPVRVGGGRPVPVPHKQISGCALPCGHGRPRAPRGIT